MPPINKIIVTIHGIHTEKKGVDWQESFRYFVKANRPEISVLNYKYGFVLGLVSWFDVLFGGINKTLKLTKFFHDGYVDGFVKFLKKTVKENPDSEISIIAHSFGTWITHEMLSRGYGFNLKNIVFVAGVFSSHIEKTCLNWALQNEYISRAHAWSSKKDFVVEGIAIFPFGHLGYWGFTRADHFEDRDKPQEQPYPNLQLFNHVTDEEHSGVVDKLDTYGLLLLQQLLTSTTPIQTA